MRQNQLWIQEFASYTLITFDSTVTLSRAENRRRLKLSTTIIRACFRLPRKAKMQ
jgi:hypothetical protein